MKDILIGGLTGLGLGLLVTVLAKQSKPRRKVRGYRKVGNLIALVVS